MGARAGAGQKKVADMDAQELAELAAEIPNRVQSALCFLIAEYPQHVAGFVAAFKLSDSEVSAAKQTLQKKQGAQRRALDTIGSGIVAQAPDATSLAKGSSILSLRASRSGS